MKQFWWMFVATTKEFIRDKSGLFWMLIFPVVFIFIFGMIYSGGGEQTFNLRVGVAGEDGIIFQEIVDNMSKQENMEIYTGTREEELKALENGERNIVLVIPRIEFENLIQGEQYEVEMYYDSSRSQLNRILITNFERAFLEMEDSITGRQRSIKTIARPVQGERLSDFAYILPGILAMALMQLGLFGSLQFLNLREEKIIRGLSITPLSRVNLLASEVLLRILIGFVQAVIIILIGRYIFGVTIVNQLYKIFLLVLLGSVTFVSIGYMLICFVNSSEGGNGLLQVVQFPMMFLSGIFFPLEIMPDYIKPLVKFIPLTYLGDALRQIMVGIKGEYSMITNIGILFIWFIATGLITIKFWKWE